MGKRRRAYISARTKTEAKAKLMALRRDQADGLPVEQRGYTVREAVESWLRYGLVGREPSTVANRRIMAEKHVIPALGARKLVELTAEEVDAWLALKAQTLSTVSVVRLLSILRSSIQRAQARELVRRNVALLCQAPRGTAGRPSKSLTLDQARAVLAAAEGTSMHAYVVVSLLTGARTEELRALTWDHLRPRRPAAFDRGVALGSAWGRDQDASVAADAGAVGPGARCVADASAAAAGGEASGRLGLGRPRVGVLHRARHRAGRGERASLVPGRGTGCRAGRGDVDATRAAAQLRLAAVQLGDADRGHRSPGRARQHEDDGAGVPQGAATGADQGRPCHGWHLP